MKNSIALLIVLSLADFVSGQTFVRKDTLRFAPDSSYSRAVIRHGEDLIIATSKNGVIRLDEKTGKSSVIIPPSESGEFRSAATGKLGIYALTSGRNGEIWRFEDNKAEMIFFSAGSFFDDIKTAGNSFVFLGDPDSLGFVLHKIAETMLPVTELNPPKAFKDEACYAASATTLFLFSEKHIAFVSGGGNHARYHFTRNNGKSWNSVDLPMSGSDGCGPFSIHFITKNRGMIVGGCYTKPTASDSTSLYTGDGGKTWQVSRTATNGYRSCVAGNRKIQFACGTTGIDVSTDGGKSWKVFDKGNFCALLPEKKYLYATTNKGYVVRYRLKN